MNKKVMIMAGGTGGHVFPGLAVAEALMAQGCDVVWLGTKTGIEARLVPAANIYIHYMNAVGIRGKGIKQLIAAPFKISQAVWQSFRILRSENPGCVLGMGGFVAGPGALAATLLGKPLVIHEQNAVAGTTNRLVAKLAKRVFQAFPNTFAASRKLATVGNPVRQSLQQKQPATHELLRVLVVGGSLGAKAINDIMPELVDKVSGIALWHQTGKAQEQELLARYQGYRDVRVSAFIDDMNEAYQWADVIICRAGAMTVSEVAAVGIAAIFIPFPFAIDDHQTANAQFLVQQQAALIMPQQQMTAERLAAILSDWQQHPEKRQQLAANAAKLGVRDAANKVMQACLELA